MSESSSQRQRELPFAQHKREKIERQNEATLRLGKQQQELEPQQLQEGNRKRLEEARIVELELQDKLYEVNDDFHETFVTTEWCERGQRQSKDKRMDQQLAGCSYQHQSIGSSGFHGHWDVDCYHYLSDILSAANENY